MSLINQVLKDLEQRREAPVSSVDGSIVTMPRYTVARRDGSFIISIFTVLLIMLSFVTGFLVWERIIERQSSSAMNMVPAPDLQQTETLITDTPAAIKTSSTEVGREQSTIAEGKLIKKENNSSTKLKSEAKIPVSSLMAETEVSDQGEAKIIAGTVEKQRRALTKQQQANQAFQKGYAVLRKGQMEKGEQLFNTALHHYSRHIKSREMLAGIYIKAGRYVEAAQLLKQGVALNPGHSMFRKLYARVLLEQDALDSAVAILERSLPKMDQDIDYYALLAALYQRQGRHKNAVALYKNMLRQNAMVGIWWIGMGISLEKLGDSQTARQAYEKARASGTLAAQMVQYTDNRLMALNEIGYPDEEM